mgnify:CR=1 FL=1
MPKIIDEEKIFVTVIKILVSHGYEGATTKEIAEVAGVNEATLFRKYGSKAELFEKAINRQFSDTPLNVLVCTNNLENDLLTIVKAYMETNALHGEVIPALLAALPRHPELKGAFNVAWGNIQIMVRIIQQHQAEGQLREESPFACLNTLVGPLMTDQMFRRANLDFPIPDISPEKYVEAFLHGRKL